MKASPIVPNFNSGEFSGLMFGRTDYKNFFSAVRKTRNFIPTPQGPMRRRPGTRFVAEIADSTIRTWITRFVFGGNQAYVVEFDNHAIRFYANHGVVGAPFILSSPYGWPDLIDEDGSFKLRFAQSGDVVYITHPGIAPQKLTRTGASTFTIAPVVFKGGPFNDLDPTNIINVSTSAQTGVVTLTASGAIFQPDIFNPNLYVGSLFYLEDPHNAAGVIPRWEPGKAIAGPGIRRRVDNRYYISVAAGNTGTVTPTHTRGSLADGDPGVTWTFEDAGFGWAQITAITDATHATAQVLSPYPYVCIGGGTPRWAFSAWNNRVGWPSNVAFWRDRLCFLATRRIWCSVAGDYENFEATDDNGTIVQDAAVTIDITSGTANDIKWASPSDQALIIGTGGDEQALFETSESEAFGPGNATCRKQTAHGSRGCAPETVGQGIVYVQNSGRKLRDIRMSEFSVVQKWDSKDLTLVSEHITTGISDLLTPLSNQIKGITQIAYQQEPDSVLWCNRADGVLLGFTFNHEEAIQGWHPHRIGGYSDQSELKYAIVESVATIPAPTLDRDELWIIVRRFINGFTKRYVEWLEHHHHVGDDPEDAFYVDCGLSLNNVINATLQPGANCTVQGAVNVPFVAGGAVFAPGDVGRHIHYSFQTTDAEGNVIWNKADATITHYTGPTQVEGTINSPWPEILNPTGGGGSVTGITITNPGNGYGYGVAAPGPLAPVVTIAPPGGGGVTATARVHMKVQGVVQELFGINYLPLDVCTLPGGTSTRPATFEIFVKNNAIGWQVKDGGDFTAVPAFNDGAGGFWGNGTGTLVSGGSGTGASLAPIWGIDHIEILTPGSGYGAPPAVTIGPPGGPTGTGMPLNSQVQATAIASISPGGSIGTGTTALILANGWRMTVTSVSGLAHLEGQLVDIVCDGVPQAQQRVAGGALTLAVAASKVHVGFPCPAMLSPMPMDSGAADGTAQGKTKRISKLSMRFHSTSSKILYGRDEFSQMDTITRADMSLTTGQQTFTGDILRAWPDGYSVDSRLTVKAVDPAPCTIVALMLKVETQDDR